MIDGRPSYHFCYGFLVDHTHTHTIRENPLLPFLFDLLNSFSRCSLACCACSCELNCLVGLSFAKCCSFPQWVSSFLLLYDSNSVWHLLFFLVPDLDPFFNSIPVSWRKDGTNWTQSDLLFPWDWMSFAKWIREADLLCTLFADLSFRAGATEWANITREQGQILM